MTRLKRLLLTGTIMPALALTPLAGAFAQVPETVQRQLQERQKQLRDAGGEHQEQRGGAAPHAPGGEMRAPPAPRGPAAERPAPNRAERAAPPAPHEAPAAHPAERPAERATPPGREVPAERRGERPNPAAGHPAERKAEPPADHKMDRAAPPKAAETPAERKAETPAERKMDRAAPPKAAETPAERKAETPAERRMDHATPADNSGQRPGERGGDHGGQHRPDAATPAPAPGAPAGGPNGRDEGRPNGAGRPGAPNGGQPGGPDRSGRPDQQNYQNGNQYNRGNDRRSGIGPGGAAAIGAAAGFAGGFLAATGARDLAGIRGDRREVVEDGRTYIREPGRTIVEDGDRAYIVHDENDRFRELGYDIRRERRGSDFVDVVDRPDGTQILTYTTPDGRMLRRVRRYRDGREFVLIDNGYDGRVRPIQDDIVDLPPPPIDIPRDRYAVDYADVDEGVIYDTFVAPPLRAPPRRYTLDQIRYSPDIRRYVRSVDINTINFASGSWIVPGSATGKLQALATGIKRTLAKDPNSVFLVEGYTDATGNPTDNLSLSDRRAQSVAAILTKDFNVPPENLTTQGYGQQDLKVNTQGPSAENRRVVVQNITPLLAAGGNPPPPPPR